jgi:hypothetical protein
MVGIYNDDFVKYLKRHLGSNNVKITTKNIVIPCLWCEYPKQKDHYHLHIGLDEPIYNCFHGGCGESGTIKKLLNQIHGYDISGRFVDKKHFEDLKQKRLEKVEKLYSKFTLPPLEADRFPLKRLSLKKRMKFLDLPLERIEGLIFDVDAFLSLNKIWVTDKMAKLLPFLQKNFIGFLMHNGGYLMFRNIEKNNPFRYYKYELQATPFLDYYMIKGQNPNSNKVVLAEGIYDILTERHFDHLNVLNDVKLYASVGSASYLNLMKSLIFHEKVFTPRWIFLSDNGIHLNYYKKIKRNNPYLFIRGESLVYYNKNGKDFNDTPVIAEKFII